MKKENDYMIVMTMILFIFFLKGVSSSNSIIDISASVDISNKSTEIDLVSKAISTESDNLIINLMGSEGLLMNSGSILKGSPVFLEQSDSSNSTEYQTDDIDNSTYTNTTETRGNSTDTENPFNRSNACSDFCPFTSSFFCQIIFGRGENNAIPFILLGVMFLVNVLVIALFSLWRFRSNTQIDNPEMIDKKNGTDILKNDIERNPNVSSNQSRGRKVYSNNEHIVPVEVEEPGDSYPQIPEDHQTLVKSKIFFIFFFLLKFNPEPA